MKKGKLSTKDRQFIVDSQKQGLDVKEIAKVLDRSVELINKVVSDQSTSSDVAPSEPKPVVNQDPDYVDKEAMREEASNEFIKQQNRAPSKGVVIGTAAKSGRVDEIIAAMPSEYFNEEFMGRHPNRRTDVNGGLGR